MQLFFFFATIGHPKTLDQITYKDKDMHDILFRCFESISLVGVTGDLHFSDGDQPDKMLQFERIQGRYKNIHYLM